MIFQGAHILSISQFDREDVKRLFDIADQMQPYALRQKVTRVLEGAILGNMFFEASTRTRVNFGSPLSTYSAVKFVRPQGLKALHWSRVSPSDTARVLSGLVMLFVCVILLRGR